MRHCRTAFLLATVLAFASWASASEEEIMGVNQAQVKTVSSSEQTGTAVFEAQTDGGEYKAVSISAFGKEFKLDKPQLEKLKGLPVSSLEVTHEAGYESLGGHTIYFKFKRQQIHPDTKKVLKTGVTISISKGKGLAVSDPHTVELKESKLPIGW